MDEFDKAALAGDEKRMREILLKVDLGAESAGPIIERVRKSPPAVYPKKKE